MLTQSQWPENPPVPLPVSVLLSEDLTYVQIQTREEAILQTAQLFKYGLKF